ncbi:MAG: hypothetical protein ABR961_07140 [Thermoanaerobaculaceae bacterium]
MRASRSLLLRLAAVAALGAVALWATSGKPPRLPADPDHSVGEAETRCLRCHVHTGAHPRPTDHPLRDDCFSCHRDARGVLHPRQGASTDLPGGWKDDPGLAGRAGGRGGGR